MKVSCEVFMSHPTQILSLNRETWSTTRSVGPPCTVWSSCVINTLNKSPLSQEFICQLCDKLPNYILKVPQRPKAFITETLLTGNLMLSPICVLFSVEEFRSEQPQYSNQLSTTGVGVLREVMPRKLNGRVLKLPSVNVDFGGFQRILPGRRPSQPGIEIRSPSG